MNIISRHKASTPLIRLTALTNIITARTLTNRPLLHSPSRAPPGPVASLLELVPDQTWRTGHLDSFTVVALDVVGRVHGRQKARAKVVPVEAAQVAHAVAEALLRLASLLLLVPDQTGSAAQFSGGTVDARKVVFGVNSRDVAGSVFISVIVKGAEAAGVEPLLSSLSRPIASLELVVPNQLVGAPLMGRVAVIALNVSMRIFIGDKAATVLVRGAFVADIIPPLLNDGPLGPLPPRVAASLAPLVPHQTRRTAHLVSVAVGASNVLGGVVRRHVAAAPFVLVEDAQVADVPPGGGVSSVVVGPVAGLDVLVPDQAAGALHGDGFAVGALDVGGGFKFGSWEVAVFVVVTLFALVVLADGLQGQSGGGH